MQETLQYLWFKLLEYWFLIGGVTVTFIMAVLRTHKRTGKIDFVEAVMCAIFTYGAYFLLSWFKLPQESLILIGSFLGYYGTAKVTKLVSDRLGSEDIK